MQNVLSIFATKCEKLGLDIHLTGLSWTVYTNNYLNNKPSDSTWHLPTISNMVLLISSVWEFKKKSWFPVFYWFYILKTNKKKYKFIQKQKSTENLFRKSNFSCLLMIIYSQYQNFPFSHKQLVSLWHNFDSGNHKLNFLFT